MIAYANYLESSKESDWLFPVMHTLQGKACGAGGGGGPEILFGN